MADWTDSLQVFCADIGSIARGKFAWARRIPADAEEELHEPSSIHSLGEAVASELKRERPVALGFEMPLFVPVPADPEQLGKARPCDSNAPAWCSPVGANVLATGIPQVAWLLRHVHDSVPQVDLYLEWEPFAAARQGLLLWEAFVTSDAKGESDEEDATIGINAFCAQLPSPGDADANETELPLSLGAAAGVWAGWDLPADALRLPCIVVRA